MIRRVAIAAVVILVITGTVLLIVLGAQEDDRARQACTARGGTMVQTGMHLMPAGKGVMVPVPEYTCKTK